MDMDFATSCPLVRPYLPRIRLLFVGSRFRSTLPSDGPSRFRPCASLVLHLHQVAQGTFTPRLPDMPGTQEGAACGGACWASLTAAGRSTLGMSGRDEETAPSTGPGNGVKRPASRAATPLRSTGWCYPCARSKVLPMCPVEPRPGHLSRDMRVAMARTRSTACTDLGNDSPRRWLLPSWPGSSGPSIQARVPRQVARTRRAMTRKQRPSLIYAYAGLTGGVSGWLCC